MTQGQMFPMTEEERIAILRGNLASDVEKRLAKRDAAAVAFADAQDAEDGARGLLDVFDRMVRERASQHAGLAMDGDTYQAAVKLKRNAEKAGLGLSFAVNGGEPIVITEEPIVDPITGEVTSKADAVSCDTCVRDCNLRQRKGSGHTGCGDGSWEPRKPEVDPITGEVTTELGDFPCTYCRGIDHHDPTCQLLVLRRIPVAPEPDVRNVILDPITGEVEALDDDLFSSAVELVRSTAAASESLLQRRLSIGYAQAGQLLDRMEAEGVILPAEPGSKARKVVAADQGSVTGAAAEKGTS